MLHQAKIPCDIQRKASKKHHLTYEIKAICSIRHFYVAKIIILVIFAIDKVVRLLCNRGSMFPAKEESKNESDEGKSSGLKWRTRPLSTKN